MPRSLSNNYFIVTLIRLLDVLNYWLYRHTHVHYDDDYYYYYMSLPDYIVSHAEAMPTQV
jgi:hypothetical protein